MAEVDAAETKLSQRCLDQRQLRTSLPEVDQAVRRRDGVERANRLYGITDENVARTQGYMPSFVRGPRAKEPAWTNQALVAFWGADPAKGGDLPTSTSCLGQARVRLYGSLLDAARVPLADNLRRITWETSRNAAGVRAAAAAWASCMTRAGYPKLVDPLEADAAFVTRPPASAASLAEISQALADIGCKSQSKLVTTWGAEEAKVAAGQIANKNKASLEGERARWVATVGRARDVLARG